MERQQPPVTEMLSGYNYKTWSINMKNHLEAEGLWGVVSGEEVCRRSSVDEWKRKNAKALRAIRINCNKGIYSRIHSGSTANNVWASFLKMFRRREGIIEEIEGSGPGNQRFVSRDPSNQEESVMEREKPPVTEKLNEDNYRTWRIEMQAYFLAEGLWGVVLGEESPDGASSNDWTRKNTAALRAIRSNCCAIVLEMIDNASTAKDAWEALLRRFRTESNLENSGPFYQEKLNGTNYRTWRANMKNYLEAEGLWGVVSGEELRVKENGAISSEWEKKNAAALCAIRINCDKRIYCQMIDCCSAATDAWEAFFTVFRHEEGTTEGSGPSDQVMEEKLNGDNYRTWRIGMKNHLETECLWDVVTGEELRGEVGAIAGEWTRNNAVALCAIRINCGETIFPIIDNVYIAKHAWEILLKRFRPPLGIFEPEESSSNNQATSNRYPIGRAETNLLDKYRFIESGDLNYIAGRSMNGTEVIIPENRYTSLHVAVSAGRPNVVDYFLLHGSIHAPMVDSKNRTALALAAYHGKLEICRKLVDKYPRWLLLKDGRGNIPLLAACEGGHAGATRFLCVRTFDFLGRMRAAEIYEEDREFTQHIRQFDDTEFWVILKCLESKMFDIALQVLQSDPRKMFLHSSSNPLLTLAETPTTFWKLPPYGGINQIFSMDCPYLAEILRIMCEQISLLNDIDLGQSGADQAMFAAVKNGNLKFVTEIIKRNPDMMWMVDESKRDLLMCAIANRQENIASFVHGLEEWRDAIVSFDEHNNNILHMVGEIAPHSQLSRISGAALQMQRELQWFKEVESIVPDYFKESKNESKQTPSDVFTEGHKDLQKDAEKWMKETAASYSIVSALIITLLFAAAFTVPGGNDQTHGVPVYRHKVLFKIFTILVAISFSAASTSVMAFLGILTSRYAEQDFLLSLPRKLMVGLFSLFISMTVMLFAFSIAIILMFKGKVWTIVLTVLLIIIISIPISTFGRQHLPLLKEIYVSTYHWHVFKKKTSPESRPCLSTEYVRESSASETSVETTSTNEPPAETASTNEPPAETTSPNEPPAETASTSEPPAETASSSEPPAETVVEISSLLRGKELL